MAAMVDIQIYLKTKEIYGKVQYLIFIIFPYWHYS